MMSCAFRSTCLLYICKLVIDFAEVVWIGSMWVKQSLRDSLKQCAHQALTHGLFDMAAHLPWPLYFDTRLPVSVPPRAYFWLLLTPSKPGQKMTRYMRIFYACIWKYVVYYCNWADTELGRVLLGSRERRCCKGHCKAPSFPSPGAVLTFLCWRAIACSQLATSRQF